LQTAAGQSSAVAFGLRPVSGTAAFNETALAGLDASQPLVRFAPASAETLLAVQSVWQAARKPINLVMLLDTSGSMRGARMENMRSAAMTFVEQMGDDDFITIIAFADSPSEIVSHARLGDSRNQVLSLIEGLEARGNTTLYDAVGEGGRAIGRTTTSSASNVMVVLSDGADTASVSFRGITSELIDLATDNNTTIFTISYGDSADTELMRELATRANGNHYVGDEASIALIYEEMSAAFGGSVGIGR
jgi:Ca-activated chloride channel homolog